MNRRLHGRLIYAFIAVAGFSGCDERETPAQLQTWMAAIRNGVTATSPPPIAVPAFAALSYHADTDRTPFDRTQTDDPDVPYSRPAQRGNAQPLEDFPVESIQMVGTISQEGRRHVLLQAERIVYQAKVGDYLGKNFGMIRRIADNEIEMEELLPAAEGRWTTRRTTLPLRGGKK